MVDEQHYNNKRTISQLVYPKIENVGLYCGTTSTNLSVTSDQIDGNIYNNQMTFSGQNAAQLQNPSQCEILSTTTINEEIVNNNIQPSSINCLSEQQNLSQQQNIQSLNNNNISSSSIEKNNNSNSGPSLTCTVCGDVATGKHYGSVACNGCKGFFRRTIRRNYKYTCRFNSNCQIDKHNRAVCRACRYSRCIMFGMKVDAVQSERDLIGKRSRYSSTSGTPGPSVIPSTSSPQSIQHQKSLEEEKQHSPLSKDEQIHQQQTQQIVQQQQPQTQNNVLLTSSQQHSSDLMIKQTNSSQFCDTTEEPISRKRSLSNGSNYEQIKPARINFSNNKSKIPSHLLTTTTQSEQINQNQPQSELIENSDPWSGQNGRALLRHLLCSEEKISNMRDTVVAHACTLQYSTRGSKFPFTGEGTRKASENDILQSLHTQLLLVIEWAKTLKPFADLPTEDQTALLKNFAAQHVVLCVAYRSTTEFLKLINDSCIPRVVNGAEKEQVFLIEYLNFSKNISFFSFIEFLFYRRDAERVMDMLVSPMRFLRMDDVEFVALKACILFNPVARGLSSNSVMSILQTRRYIFRALQNYVRAKAPNDEDRIGDLTFFVLSPLQSLAKAVSEDVLVSKITGIARLDQLMEELMLEDLDLKEMSMGNDSNQCEESSSTIQQKQEIEQNSINIQANVNSSNTTSISAPINSHSQSVNAQWSISGTIQPNSPTYKQRGRNVSSASDSSQATSSSSASPTQTFLQPVPGTPSPYSTTGGITVTGGGGGISVSPISESEFSSSALSSYVFGNSLSCNYMQPPFAWNSPTTTGMQSNDIYFTSNNATTSTKLISQTSPISSSSITASPIYNNPPNSTQYYNPIQENLINYNKSQNTQQKQEERALPREEINNHLINNRQQPNCAWGVVNTQMQHHFVQTPPTPVPAIYSGTSPSPPQRFGSVRGGAR